MKGKGCGRPSSVKEDAEVASFFRRRIGDEVGVGVAISHD
jgi:protoporphyrinogen oxidase